MCINIIFYSFIWIFNGFSILVHVLGTGHFGVIHLAKISRKNTNENDQKVALKMPKDTSNKASTKTLEIELKVLCHLGKHLNVVNLVGAYSSEISTGKFPYYDSNDMIW